jgi:hypothetical protein
LMRARSRKAFEDTKVKYYSIQTHFGPPKSATYDHIITILNLLKFKN